MSWYQYIPAALSAVSAISESNQVSGGTANQGSYQKYEAQRQYEVSTSNIRAQQAIAKANAASVASGSKFKAEMVEDEALFNANMIKATTAYNDELLDYEEELLWEQADLDLDLLARRRAVERGTIKAQQSASGTVMGEGSNAEVIIDQKTQEALDAFVVRRSADIAARKIQNQRAQNIWQGEMAIQKTLYQGKLSKLSTQYSGTAQANSILAQSGIKAKADKISAGFSRDSGFSRGRNTTQAGKDASWNRLTSGLLSAGAQAASTHYDNKSTSLMENEQRSMIIEVPSLMENE